MRERFRDRPLLGLEEKADVALAAGAFADGEAYLDELLRTRPDPYKFHHAILKKTALPLYEMAYGVDSPESYGAIYEDADALYGLTGQLIQHELYTFSHAYHEEVGRISELTFFALHLRQLFSEKTTSVMIPAPATDDKRGIDFYKSPVGTKKIVDGQPYQIKTRATPEVRAQYKNSKVVLISMSDIDKHAGNPNHPESLPRTILRELGIPLIGETVSNEGFNPKTDRKRLNRAHAQIERIANGDDINSTEEALARASLRGIELDVA